MFTTLAFFYTSIRVDSWPGREQAMQRNNILDLVGRTPIVAIRRLNPHKKVTIYAKLEAFNPGGSVKDRIALHMIETAEKAES